MYIYWTSAIIYSGVTEIGGHMAVNIGPNNTEAI